MAISSMRVVLLGFLLAIDRASAFQPIFHSPPSSFPRSSRQLPVLGADPVGLSERSLDYLKRTHRNVKSMTLMTEKQLIMQPDSEEIMDRAEALAAETAEIELALLAKLSLEDPLPQLGQGSLARRELDLPPSRVMVTGGGGVLAGLIFGKLQRATGTGAINNVGLKHPNVLATNSDDVGTLNRILMGRFKGAGCWNEKTEVQSTAAWDDGIGGVMEDFKLAVAGDERPFILVPRDGCDVVVIGSRLAVKGSYKWGLSMSLDHAVEAPPMPEAKELGAVYDGSAPPPLTQRALFAQHVEAAAQGLNLDTQQRKREAARSSTRGPVRQIVALLHPADCADEESLKETLACLFEAAGDCPVTAVTTPPGIGLASTKLWTTRESQPAGAPGRPSGEFLEALRVSAFPVGGEGAVEAAAGKIASAAEGEGAGAVTLSQESYAEVVTQLLLLADAGTSRIVVVAPDGDGDGGGGWGEGAAIPAGVVESEDVLSAFRAAGL
jgi:hypothetical protein